MRWLSILALVGCGASPASPPRTREVAIDPIATPFLLHGDLADGEVALTFDDGPEPTTTRRILATLADHDVRAMFFQVGRNAEAHPEVTAEIARAGHVLGSHSFDHMDLSALPTDEALANALRGHAAIDGTAPFFRFPFFRSTDALRGAVAARGFATFHANIVSEDHSTPDPDELLAKSLAAVEAERRGIVIFHDIQPQTADMLDAFLTTLDARGYRTVVFVPQ